jgi:hypothetical protein
MRDKLRHRHSAISDRYGRLTAAAVLRGDMGGSS